MIWLHTFPAGGIDIEHVRPADIEIVDIARSLAATARFRGQTHWQGRWRLYTVAEHCVVVSRLLDAIDEKRWGLLHDVAEAYLQDVVRPIRRLALSPWFFEAEARIERACAERFGLAPFEGSLRCRVEAADQNALESEIEHLTPIPMEESRKDKANYWQEHPPQDAVCACELFMGWARELGLR